jgi:hypothetical protein
MARIWEPEVHQAGASREIELEGLNRSRCIRSFIYASMRARVSVTEKPLLCVLDIVYSVLA